MSCRNLRIADFARAALLFTLAGSGCGGGGGAETSNDASIAVDSSAIVSNDASIGSDSSAGSAVDGGKAPGDAGLAVSVLTNRYDNLRSGANPQETQLTAANVNVAKFGLLFSQPVDGLIYAQPLYVSGMTLPDGKTRDVVFVATEHNSVYAFDAQTPGAPPLWQRSLGPSGPVAPFGCTDMTAEVGITSTPVIDPQSSTMYVVAKSYEAGEWMQRLHAIDISTGNERSGSPVAIQASVPGSGAGSANGAVAFNPMTALNRPGLLFLNGVVYIAFASHCDFGPYHGWILAYADNGAGLHLTRAYNVTPNGTQGGIWQAGVGLSTDGDSIYFAVGNGSDVPNSSPPEISEGVGRLGVTDFSLKDYWLPTDYVNLNGADSDMSTGAILLPHNRVLTGSKDGKLYVMDRANLGKYNAAGDQILQTLTTPGKADGQRGHLHGGPIYYNDPTLTTEWVYLWPEESELIGYKMDPATHLLLSPAVQSIVPKPGHPGGILTLSSNGGTKGTGILWGSAPKIDAWHQTEPGILYAFDATDVTHVLWSSDQNAARDGVGNFAKFCPPVVANGRVYLATFSNALRVYGLLH